MSRLLSAVSARWWWAGLLGILALYAGLSLYQINLPGLHYDEAFEAVPALQLMLNRPVTAFRNSGLTVNGRLFPLMTQDYIGAINLYAAIPFIALFGTTPAALRVMSILFGALTLLFTFGLGRRLTGAPGTGLAAALLLAVDPTFIFWNRQGVFVTAVTATIGVAAAYCWLRRLQGQSGGWSAAGAFLFGLGLYAKLLFLWLIFGLVGALLLLNLKRLVQNKNRWVEWLKRILFPEATVATVAFLLGCWPLLVYNIQTGGTLRSITENAATSYYGTNNLAVGANLAQRMQQLVALLDGGHLWYLGTIIHNPLGPGVFVVVLLVVVIFATRKSPAPSGSDFSPGFAPNFRILGQTLSPAKIALFPLLVIGLVVVASVATVSALWITHFAVLMPWPALAITTGGWYLLKNRSGLGRPLAQTVTLAAGLGLAALVVSNLAAVIGYHRALSTSGGLSTHSDAIYDMSDWLDENARGLVVAMDWGLAAPVVYLTHGRVNAVEVFGYRWQPDAELNERLQTFIRQPDTLYLWRAPDEIIFDRSTQFKALYRPLNLEETIEEAFYERSGRPVLGVTQLVEKGTAANPPR